MPATMFDLIEAKQHDNAGKLVLNGKVLKPEAYFEPEWEKFL